MQYLIFVPLTLIVTYLGIALALTFSQFPKHKLDGKTLNFERISRAQRPNLALQNDQARDGTHLNFREIKPTEQNKPLIVLIHGSGWHGKSYTGLAQNIANQTGAHILVPDLRGHGPNANQRGDVSYIGQLEDDLADLISHKSVNNQPVFMVGHSSGGGLVVRFSAGAHGRLVNAAVLISPFLKYNAPTVRLNSGGWAHALFRRIIGLTMLNLVKITQLNHLPVVQLNFAQSVLERDTQNSATTQYSFRLNQSYAPRNDYLSDIAALPRFLLIAGENDEAFKAEAFEPLMSAQTSNGTYRLLPGLGHLDIVDSKSAADEIVQFLNARPKMQI